MPTKRMALLRRAIYRVGFRPKWPSVFFSPTLSIEYAWRKSFMEAGKPFDHAVLEGETKATAELLYNSMLFMAKVCPVCSKPLLPVSDRSRSCKNGHGTISVREDEHGLPVLVFDVKGLG